MDAQQSKPVPAVMRAAAILDRVAGAKTPPTLSELVRDLALPKSSVHGLCRTLCTLGLLRLQDNGGFKIGPHVMQWANVFLSQNDLVDLFHDLLSKDQQLEKYTITLSSLDGGDVVYMACRNSSAPLGVSFQIGMRLPAVFTATGKAMLATLDPQNLENSLPTPWPAGLTANSVSGRKALAKELAEIRQRGYSIDDGQIRDGMICLGAPILDASGKAIAGIALSMMQAEAMPEVIARVGAGVAEIGRQLSVRLGNSQTRAFPPV